MNWYRVIVSFEVEGETEEDATREANKIVPDGIVEGVAFIEEIKDTPQG